MSAGRIEVDDVSVVFGRRDDEVVALDRLSLDVRPGELVTVIGPSGCGKSTLLDLVAGFQRPTLGKVLEDGAPIVEPAPDRMLVFQHNALFPWKTVLENVSLGPKLRGEKRAARERLAREQLRTVGLEGFERRYPHQLSGGMQRRVEIARALVNDPKVLLMDEPFGALDAITRQRMQRQLLELWSRTGKTVIFVTHDVVEAVYLSDRVLVMSARPGRVMLELAVDLPRPRDFRVITTPAATALIDRALAAIHEQVA